MLSNLEHLLLKLSEECSEVSKVVHKAVLFGLYTGHPEKNQTNYEELLYELTDLIAVTELLREYNVNWEPSREAIEAKKAKVRKWMSVARELETLEKTTEAQK